MKPKFSTITADDWKRSIATARATPNVVSQQIKAAIAAKKST